MGWDGGCGLVAAQLGTSYERNTASEYVNIGCVLGQGAGVGLNQAITGV